MSAKMKVIQHIFHTCPLINYLAFRFGKSLREQVNNTSQIDHNILPKAHEASRRCHLNGKTSFDFALAWWHRFDVFWRHIDAW